MTFVKLFIINVAENCLSTHVNSVGSDQHVHWLRRLIRAIVIACAVRYGFLRDNIIDAICLLLVIFCGRKLFFVMPVRAAWLPTSLRNCCADWSETLLIVCTVKS